MTGVQTCALPICKILVQFKNIEENDRFENEDDGKIIEILHGMNPECSTEHQINTNPFKTNFVNSDNK